MRACYDWERFAAGDPDAYYATGSLPYRQVVGTLFDKYYDVIEPVNGSRNVVEVRCVFTDAPWGVCAVC